MGSNVKCCALCGASYFKDRMVLNLHKGWAICFECTKTVVRMAPKSGLGVRLSKDGEVRFTEVVPRPRVQKAIEKVTAPKKIVPLAFRKRQQQSA